MPQVPIYSLVKQLIIYKKALLLSTCILYTLMSLHLDKQLDFGHLKALFYLSVSDKKSSSDALIIERRIRLGV